MEIFAYSYDGIIGTRLPFSIIKLDKAYEAYCFQKKGKRSYMTISLKEDYNCWRRQAPELPSISSWKHLPDHRMWEAKTEHASWNKRQRIKFGAVKVAEIHRAWFQRGKAPEIYIRSLWIFKSMLNRACAGWNYIKHYHGKNSYGGIVTKTISGTKQYWEILSSDSQSKEKLLNS